MEGISGLVTTIAAMAVLCALLEFCMPSGRLKRSVHIAAGLLFVLAIAQPVIALCNSAAALPMAHAAPPAPADADHQAWLQALYEEIGRAAE